MADLDLHIRRLSDDSLHADLYIDLPSGRANLGSAPIRINTETLLSLIDDTEVYGATLSAMIFPKLLREGWQRARGHAEGTGQGLHVRVVISDSSGALHALCWELLRDPLTNTPLAQQEGGSLARQVLLDKADDLSTLSLPTKSALRALVAVAGPVDAEHWG
ncbi:MAG: hypothetical protein HGB05_07750, partial [Chloroflexi bacterium]|nr:hypothetical protein [Chloroflexota bacterium]